MTTDSEARSSKLAQRVEEIEKLIRSGADVRGVSLASLLDSTQGQLDATRAEDEKLTTEKKEKEQKDRSAIAQMVEREAKLNKEEKEKYAQFLSKDYFTKSDFKDLDQFYSHSWDKLSNEGKAEMNKRVEEGVRRGQYSIDELPDSVKDRVNTKSRQPAGKSAERSDSNSGNYRNESSILEDSLSTVKEPDRETKSNGQSSKAEMPEGLAGLAKLSPVQETDAVVVPQTERGGQGQVRGG